MNAIRVPREYRRLFPMTLAPIDLLFFLDDFPDYPMSFYIELEFSGRLDRSLFEAALEEAVSRHPLLFARVEPGRKGRLSWVPDGELAPQVQWRPLGAPLEVGEGQETIDLRHEGGLRVWAAHDETACKLTLQFHHAVSDGTGAYRFLGDLLVAYFSRVAETAKDVAFGDSDWKSLRHRRAKMGDLSERAGKWAMLAPAMREWFKHARLISPVQPPAARPDRRPFPNLAVHSFSADVSKRLRTSALAQNAMLNDVLICEFFRTLQQWNPKSGRLRVMVPSDMRDGGDFGMPAANMTAYTFITRNASQVGSDDLLASICQDTQEIKNGGPQQRFMDSIMFGTAGAGIFRMIMKRNWCLATAVMSNAGDPSKRFLGKLPRRRGIISGGGVTLDMITGAPPVRRKTRASVSASFYGRRLALTVRCDPNLFDVADGQRLLSVFAERLQRVADR